MILLIRWRVALAFFLELAADTVQVLDDFADVEGGFELAGTLALLEHAQVELGQVVDRRVLLVVLARAVLVARVLVRLHVDDLPQGHLYVVDASGAARVVHVDSELDCLITEVQRLFERSNY